MHIYILCSNNIIIVGKCESQNAERGTEVMWFHTGNYTEMIQEVWSSHDATVASQQLLFVAAQLSSLGSAAYPLSRSRDVFPLDRFALTEVNIANRNSQLLAMQMSPLQDFTTRTSPVIPL